MMLQNEVFIEKYRPKTLQEVSGIDISFLKKIISQPQSMPHLLLYSKAPGTGKTTIAKVIISELGAESLFLNASDERKIEDIRDKVKRFVQNQSFHNVSRIVFLDECDGMLKLSQEALRSIMEQYPAKFIITCNDINKIISPIQSRCVKINLELPKKNDILQRLQYICKQEQIEYVNDALKRIIDNNYPSIRNMINQMQLLSLQYEKISLEHIKKDIDKFTEIYSLVKSGKIEEARQQWITQGLQLKDMLKQFFELLWIDTLTIEQKKESINVLAEAYHRMSFDESDITLVWFCIKFREIVKNGSK